MPARIRLLLGINVFWLALSMLSDGINTLVMPARLLGQTPESQKATALGAVTFIGLAAAMLTQPIAGLVSDRLRVRWGRRGVLGLGVLLILASLLAFALGSGLTAILASFVLLQIAASSAQAAQQGFIPDLVPSKQRGTASGLKFLMDLGGAFLGFALLGTLLGTGGISTAVGGVAAVVIVTFLLTLALVREPRRDPQSSIVDPHEKVRGGHLLAAFRFDWRRHRAFAWLVVSRFLFLLATYAIGRFFFFFIADRLGLGPDQAAEQAGVLLAALTLVTALGALLGGWAADRFGRIPLMTSGAMLSAAGALLLITASSAWHVLLFGGLTSLGSAAFVGANWAMTADLAPPEEAARFMGLANLGTGGAVAAAGLLGPLVDWGNGLEPGRGYTALFVVSALVFVMSAAVLRTLRLPGPRPVDTRLPAAK